MKNEKNLNELKKIAARVKAGHLGRRRDEGLRGEGEGCGRPAHPGEEALRPRRVPPALERPARGLGALTSGSSSFSAHG
jgi:hypothetical protein